MPFSFHTDRPRYFEIQRATALESVIPFIERVRPLGAGDSVLEIGSAEGGVLAAFLERGCRGTGIELSERRAKLATEYLAEPIDQGMATIVSRNVYDLVDAPEYRHAFDVIVLKDVIEHIHDQARLLRALHGLLKQQGVVFLGFPPWQMPFGGHQQMFESRLLALAPYTHLLPRPAYERLMHAMGETPGRIERMLEIKDTGISIETFERFVRDTAWHVEHRQLFALAPIYRHKFGLPTVRHGELLTRLPVLRNFVTTSVYYVLSARDARA